MHNIVNCVPPKCTGEITLIRKDAVEMNYTLYSNEKKRTAPHI